MEQCYHCIRNDILKICILRKFLLEASPYVVIVHNEFDDLHCIVDGVDNCHVVGGLEALRAAAGAVRTVLSGSLEEQYVEIIGNIGDLGDTAGDNVALLELIIINLAQRNNTVGKRREYGLIISCCGYGENYNITYRCQSQQQLLLQKKQDLREIEFRSER